MIHTSKENSMTRVKLLTCQHCAREYDVGELDCAEADQITHGGACISTLCSGIADTVTAASFLAYFRSKRYIEEVDNADKLEVFREALPGAAYITNFSLRDLCREYDVEPSSVGLSQIP